MRKLSFSVRHTILLFLIVGLFTGGVFYRTFEAEFAAALPNASLNGDVNDEVFEDEDVISTFDSPPSPATAVYQWLVDYDGATTGDPEQPFTALNIPMNTGTTQFDASGNGDDAEVDGGDTIYVEYTLNGDFPAGSGNQARYDSIDGVAGLPYTLPPTSCLEYDIAWKEGSEFIAVDLLFTDASDLRDRFIFDQNGVRSHPAANMNSYASDGVTGFYSRQINLSSVAGLQVAKYMIGAESDVPGSTKDAYLRNIRITDCAGSDLNVGYNGGPVTFTNEINYGAGNVFTYRAGAPTLETSDCQVGVCYHFTGTPGRIGAPSTDVTNTFTIEFWAKPEAERESSTEQNANFTISGVNGQRYAVFPPQKGAIDAGVGVSVGTNGVSVFEHGNDHLPSLLVYDDSISDWTHVVVTYDLKRPKLYLNGNLVRTGIKSLRGNIYPGTFLGGERNETPATLARGSTYGPYLGYLDEFKLYDRVLTPQQIAQNYNDGLSNVGGPTRILTNEHRVGETWTLNLFEIEADGDYLNTPIPVDTVTIVEGTSETYMTIDDPLGPFTQYINFEYTCENTENRNRDILVEFSENSGVSWSPATLVSQGGSGGVSENRILDTLCSDTGTTNSFVWDSEADAVGAQGAANPNVRVRVTADASPVGASVLSAETNDFSVQNTSAGTATVVASTYLGGDNGDDAVGIGINSSGQPVVMGLTQSEEFPTTAGAYQETDPNTTLDDQTLFVTIFEPDLSDLVYSTFIGGNGDEAAFDGALDANDNIYIYGNTGSTDFPQPAVPNGFDLTGNIDDAFLVKMNSTADDVTYFTYVGGNDYDAGTKMDVSSVQGLVLLAGWTYSNDLPVTGSAYDQTYGGNADGFAALIDTNNETLSFLSYIGGSGDDFANGVVYDEANFTVNVVGSTNSSDFSGDTSGAFDETWDGVNDDGFFMQMGTDGTLVYQTAVGGSNGSDYLSDVILTGADFDRTFYMCGATNSDDLVTSGGISSTLSGDYDMFVYALKTNFSGVDDLEMGTYFGASTATGVFEGCQHLLYRSNNTFLMVGTGAPSYPTTSNAFDQTYNGGGFEGNIVLTQFDADFTKVLYSTYFDGTQESGVRVIGDVVEATNGDIYMAGSTTSDDFPVFNGYDSTFGNHAFIQTDAFVALFDLPTPPTGEQDFSVVLRHNDETWPTIATQVDDGGSFENTIVAINTDDDSQSIVHGPTEASLLGFARDYDEAGGVFFAFADGNSSNARNIYVSRLDNNNELMWTTQLLSEGGTYTANGFIDMYSDDRGGVFVLLYDGDVFSGNHFRPVLYHLESDGDVSPNYPYDADLLAGGSYNLPGLFEYNTGVARMARVGSLNNRVMAVVTDLGQEDEFGGNIHGGNLTYFSESQGGLMIYSGEQYITGPVTTNVTDEKYGLEMIGVNSTDVVVFWWERRGAMHVLRAQYIQPDDANQELDYPFGPEGIIIGREPYPTRIQATIDGTHVFVSYASSAPALGETRVKTTEFYLDESKDWPCIQRVDGNDTFEVLFPSGSVGPHLTWTSPVTQGSLFLGNGLKAQIYDEGSGNSYWNYGGRTLTSDVALGGSSLDVSMGNPATTGLGVEGSGVEVFFTYRANSLSGGVYGFYDSVQYDNFSYAAGLQGDCDAGFTSDEVLVNTQTANAQGQVAIDDYENGNYVVIWSSRDQDDPGQADQGVFGQRFDNLDLPLGTEFQVNTSIAGDQETNRNSLAVDADGDFVVTWWDGNAADGAGRGIFMQRYDLDGNEVGVETQVNDFTTSDQEFPAVASEANGDFVVIWASNGQDGDVTGVYGKRFDASGNALTPPPAALRGTESGDEFRVNTTTTSSQEAADVAMDADGNFVVVWVDTGDLDGNNNGVFMQLYDATGAPVGAETQVNTTTVGDQGFPSVDMDVDGDFVVVWQGDDADGAGIFGQRFDAAGNPVGSEFQVNQETADDQYDPDVTLDTDGNFVVTWTSVGQDGDLDGVFYRKYDADGIAADDESQISQNSNGEQDTSAGAMVNGSYYILAWEDSSDNLDFDNESVYVRTFRDGLLPYVVADYLTFLGGDESDAIYDVEAENGLVYVTGSTLSPDFPTTAGVYDESLNSSTNMFVSVFDFDQDGTDALIASTFVGGGNGGSGLAIEVDSTSVYVGGTVGSGFPTTSGAYQETFGGNNDAVLVILSLDLTTLEYSTFLGGSDTESFAEMAVESGIVYMVGDARPGFPTTSGAYDETFSGSFQTDGFLSVIDPAGNGSSDLLYSTYLNSNTNSIDQANSVAVSGGVAYIGGYTFGSAFPTTAGAYQTTFGGGGFAADAYLMVINPAGGGTADLIYSTFIGGTGGEAIEAIAFDGQYIHAVGTGTSFPTTSGAYNESVEGNMVYLVLNPAGGGSSDLIYSSYFGGSGTATPWRVTLQDGLAYIVGQTTTTDFPITPDAFDIHSGNNDALFMVFDPSGNGDADLLYSTFVGGSNNDFFRGVALDEGYIYLGGATEGPSAGLSAFNLAGDPYDDTVSDDQDGLLMRFSGADMAAAAVPDAINDLSGFAGDTEVLLTWTAPADNGSAITDYIIEYDDGGGFQIFNDGVSTDVEVTVTGLTNTTAYTFRVAAINAEGQGAYSNELDLTPFASPVYPEISTYLGGSDDDQAKGIGLDTSGNIVVIGEARSADFPLANELQGTVSGGVDGFITILTPDGTTALISTFIGGSVDDDIRAGRVDSSGNIYIAGHSDSSDLFSGPRAPNLSGFDMTLDDAFQDVFVMKLNEDLSDVLYGSFWGGTGSDFMDSKTMRVDNAGNVYLAGVVFENGPLTANAFDSTPPGAEKDAFVAKIDTTVSGNSSLVYSSYVGGVNGEEYAWGVNYDSAGNIYLAGETNGADFPGITSGAHRETIDTTNIDGFVLKIDPTGTNVTSLVYGTSFGGDNDYDGAYDVVPDSNGDFFVCGQFWSDDAVTTTGAYSQTHFGEGDAALYHISPDGNGANDLLYGTYLGGTADDWCNEMYLDANGTLVFSGTSYGDFPTTVDAFQADAAGDADVILGRFDPAGNGTADLVFASYFGGGNTEYDQGAYYDDANDIYYLSGETLSQNLPITTGIFQEDLGGGWDGFAMSMEMPNAETGVPVIGTCKQFDNSTDCADGQTVRAAINGVLDPSTTTTSGGTWTLSDVAIVAGDTLTVYVDGASEANEAVAVTKYDGTGDVTGVELIESHLTIGSDDNATLTNADIALYDNSVSGDEDIFFEVDANNDLVVDDEGGHDAKLLIFVGNTYRPDSSGSGNVTTNDLQNDGTLIADGNSIFVSGDWVNTGTFTADTSTVDFNGSGTQSLISGGDSFATVTHSGSGTLQQDGALTVTSTFNNTAGTFDLNGYAWTMTGASLFNDGVVQLQGNESITMTTNDTNSGTWRYVGDGASGISSFGIISDFAVSGDYYHLIIDADPSETFDIGNTLTVNGDFSVLSGTFDQLVDNVAVSGNFALSDATYTQGSGTLTVDGSLTMTVGSVFDGSDTGAAIDVNGNNVTIAGSFTSTSGTFSFSGQGFGTGGASFLHNNGTVVFDRSGDFAVQTIDGGTFNHFTKSTSDEGQELVFSSANTFTFVGDLILQGGGSNFLTIQGNAGQWTLDAQGSRTVSRLLVRDSNNISDTIDARGTNSSSLGNNYNWLFEGGSFGRVFSDEGLTPLTVTTYTVRVAVNGVDGPSVDINSNGEFDLSGLSFSNGDVLTFYLEDETPDAVTVILASGTSLDSQVHLYQDRLIVRSENSSVPITNAHLTTAWVTGETDVFGNDGDVGVMYQMSSGVITTQSSKELFISSGTNYQPEENVNIGAGGIDINGTFTMESNLINVSGDWDATGGTSTSSGTVHFNGSGQTVMTNEQTFQHVTFSGAGIKTITSDFTVNGNLTYNPTGWYVAGGGAMRTIDLYGNFSYTAAVGSTFGLSNLTLRMTGTNEQTISKSATEFFSSPLIIDKPSGSVTLLSDFAMSSSFTLTSGDVVLDTFTLSATGATTISSGTMSSSTGGAYTAAGSYTQTNGDVTVTGGGNVSVQGDFNLSGGTLNTVNFYGSGGTLTQSGGTLTDVTIASSGIKTIASDFTVNGDLAYTPSGWYVAGSGAMRTIDLYGNFSYTTGVGATFGLSNLTLRMTGTNDQTISKSTVAFFGASLVIDKPSGFVGFASDFSFSNPSSVTILDGTLSLNGFSWTMTDISFSNEGILELQGNETITGLTPDINSGTWVYVGDGAAGSTTFTLYDFGATDYYNISIAGDATETFQQEATTVIANTLQVTSGTYAQNGFTTNVNGANTLIVDGGTYEQGGSALTVEGDLQVLNDGIFNGSNSGASIDVNGSVDLQSTANTVRLTTGTMTVAGDWTNRMSTGFDHNEGTVQLDTSAAAAVNGSTVWYNLTIDEATGKTITFEAGELQTFETGGTLSATGTSGNLIEFISSDPGVTQWEITHVDENTGNLSYVSVTDGGCTASSDLYLADSTNGGNNEACWIFVGAPAVPDAVDDLDATAGDEEVVLTWTAPADNGLAITDYIVEYGETSGFPGNAQVFSDGTSASTGATVTGLTNGTDYSFRVKAVNGVGESAYSNVDTATPSVIAAVPDAINDLVANPGNSQVYLSWTAPADNGSAITDYIVEYGETTGFPGNAQVFSDGTSSLTGAIVTGLVNGTEYSFRVAAVNGIGQGPYSNIDTATPGAGAGGDVDADITVDITDFLSFSIENLAAGDEAAGDQPFGAGAQITDLASTGSNDYAISGEFGSPVYTRLQTSTNSNDGYNVVAYANNLDGRTNTLLRSGGTPGASADEIPDSLTRLASGQAANESLVIANATGLAFRLTDANTHADIRGADEDTQWGDGDAGTALWAAFPLGSGAAQVIYDTLNFSATATTAYINWFVGIDPAQRSGSYSGQVTFTASVN